MNDELKGHGGSYILDKTTGKRTLVERTDEVIEKKPAKEYTKGKKPAQVAKEDLDHG